MTDKTLLIGGTHHGEWVNKIEGDVYQCQARSIDPINVIFDVEEYLLDPGKVASDVETYVRFQPTFKWDEHDKRPYPNIFYLGTMQTGDVIWYLLTNYDGHQSAIDLADAQEEIKKLRGRINDQKVTIEQMRRYHR